jgi:GH25 family lysozyme M1 (1,4-beta-N-acetylmuramidase)
MPLALDISNWGGFLGADTVRIWKEYRVSRIVVGVSHKWELARQQLIAVTEGGLEAEAYIYMYWGQDPAVQVEYARQACNGLPVRRLWVDFEDDAAPKDGPAKVKAWIYRCLDAAAALGFPLGIYTAWWWWTVWADNTDDFCNYPLWVAAYDGKANLEFPHFGGWQTCALKQYAGTTDFCGYSADLDWYKEDDMTEEEKLRLACLELANRWTALIKMGLAQQVVNEAKVLGVVAQ